MGEVKALRLLLPIDLRNHYWRYSIPLKNAASLEFCCGSDHWTSTEIQASQKTSSLHDIMLQGLEGHERNLHYLSYWLGRESTQISRFYAEEDGKKPDSLCWHPKPPRVGWVALLHTLFFCMALGVFVGLFIIIFSISRQQFWIGFGCPSPHCVRAVWRTPTCHLKDFYSVQKIFQAKKFLSNDSEWNWRK